MTIYSGLMLANFTTLAHFAVSAAMYWPNSAAEPGIGLPPSLANRSLMVASVSAALTCFVERLGDRRGRVLRRAHAPPRACLVARYEFIDGRYIGQSLRTLRRRHRQGPQLSGADISDRIRQRTEFDLHASAEQVGQRRP